MFCRADAFGCMGGRQITIMAAWATQLRSGGGGIWISRRDGSGFAGGRAHE